MPGNYLRSLNPRLPLPVWLLQVGGLMNSFGNGLVLPFLVIYLHNVRGFSLGTAGLVVAVSSFAQLVAGILAGPLIDRVGARRTLAAGLVLQALGFGLLPLVREPWQAFVLVAIEGAGSAGFWPSQSTLISRLTPHARRHAAFAQQRVTMNLGIGLGGLAGRLDRAGARPDDVHRPVRPGRVHVPGLRRGARLHPRPRRRAGGGRRLARLVRDGSCATRRSSASGR